MLLRVLVLSAIHRFVYLYTIGLIVTFLNACRHLACDGRPTLEFADSADVSALSALSAVSVGSDEVSAFQYLIF